MRELQPERVVHVLATDLRDLLARDLRQGTDAGHGADQAVDADVPGRVVGVGFGRPAARDGPTGGEDADAAHGRDCSAGVHIFEAE